MNKKRKRLGQPRPANVLDPMKSALRLHRVLVFDLEGLGAGAGLR
jgi:hypothetical protein